MLNRLLLILNQPLIEIIQEEKAQQDSIYFWSSIASSNFTLTKAKFLMDFCVEWEPQTLKRKINHATSPKTEFRVGSSWCIKNVNCCFFFFSLQTQKTERRLGGPGWNSCAQALPCTCFLQKSNTHDAVCFSDNPLQVQKAYRIRNDQIYSKYKIPVKIHCGKIFI